LKDVEEGVIVYFVVVSLHLLGGAEENNVATQLEQWFLGWDMNWDLSNTKQEC
jgi:hypothetical protein